MEKLRPCPFCGGNAEYSNHVYYVGQGIGEYSEFVYCKKCKTTTPYCGSIGESIKVCNRRSDDSPRKFVKLFCKISCNEEAGNCFRYPCEKILEFEDLYVKEGD